ncbi:MAG: DUF262 domain-containing protein [Anaerolineales bacterium]|nr:MAG: DUF262 domain-containing protein [Anaerolineales bacterium]
MAHTVMKPHEIVDYAVSGRLDIPEFQRGFKWNPGQIRDLVDSLWRDYPVGTMLFWSDDKYDQPRTFKSAVRNRRWIVDGQQRCTAFCLILGKKPSWFETQEPREWNELFDKCDVLVDLASDPSDLKFALPNPARRASPEWVSVREILTKEEPDKEIPMAYARQLLEQMGKDRRDDAAADDIHARVASVRRILHREIVTVTVGHDLEDVAEIFTRLNRAGTRVKEADTVLALIAARQEGWVRGQFLPFVEDLEEKGFSVDPTLIIRAFVSIWRRRARLRDIPRDAWRPSPEFDRGWRETKTSVANVVQFLHEQGVLSSELLPSRNALIPLFALDHAFCEGDNTKLSRAFYWFLLASRDGRYSGSSVTILDQDLAAIRDSTDFNAALGELLERLRVQPRVDAEELLLPYNRERFLRLALYLTIFHRDARDWIYSNRIGYDRSSNELNQGFKPEWHHFIPRARLRKVQPSLEDERINSLANIVVLNERANRAFRSKLPAEYLEKYGVPAQRLKEQLVPADSKLWTLDEYQRFLDVRAKKLARAMNSFLDSLERERHPST